MCNNNDDDSVVTNHDVASISNDGKTSCVDLTKNNFASRREQRKNWCNLMSKCDSEDKEYHWILVRHYESGKVAVYVDGGFEGNGHASFSSCELKYRVGDRVVCTRIGFNEGSNKFAYTFTTTVLMPNGSQVNIKELNEQVMNDHDPSILYSKVESAEIEHQVIPGEGSKSVAVYTVSSSVHDGPQINVKKRFSEFVDLDRLVRSAFSNSHLLSSIPSLPPKQSKLLVKHLDPHFIEGRRIGLETYLRKLLALPRIPQNPDVLQFLGIVPTFTTSSTSPPPVVDV